jgi:hypothetical protein
MWVIFLKVLVDGENATLEELNRLCGAKHDAFTKTRIPRRRLPMETIEGKIVEDREVGHVDLGRSYTVRF